jgi:hypothetical protein
MPKYRDLIEFLQYLRTLVEVIGSKKHNKIEFTRIELPLLKKYYSSLELISEKIKHAASTTLETQRTHH